MSVLKTDGALRLERKNHDYKKSGTGNGVRHY